MLRAAEIRDLVHAGLLASLSCFAVTTWCFAFFSSPERAAHTTSCLIMFITYLIWIVVFVAVVGRLLGADAQHHAKLGDEGGGFKPARQNVFGADQTELRLGKFKSRCRVNGILQFVQ